MRHSKDRFATAIIALGCFGFWPTITRGIEPAELIQHYERSVQPFSKIAFRIVTEEIQKSTNAKIGTVNTETELQVWNEGDNLRVLRTQQRSINGSDTPKGETNFEEWLIQRKGYTIVTRDPKTQKAKMIRARFDELPETKAGIRHAFPYAPLMGYFWNGQHSLLEILRSSQLTTRTEQANGTTYDVLESHGKWGTHTIWFDPKKNHAVVRVVQHKTADDWVKERLPLKSLEPVKNHPFLPDGPRIAHRRILEAEKFTAVNDVPVATSFRYTEEFHFPGNTVISFLTTATLTGFDSEVNDLKFVIGDNVPNGTPVIVEDRPNIAYEWRDGQIAKSISQESLTAMADVQFKKSSRTPIYFIIGGIAVVAVLGRPYRLVYSPAGCHMIDQFVVSIALVSLPSSLSNLAIAKENAATPYCGIYSVWSALRVNGISTPFEDLAEPKYVTSHLGSSLEDLCRAIHDFGGHATPLEGLSAASLSASSHPIILHVRRPGLDTPYAHWVLFLGMDGDRVRILDPPHEVGSLSTAELLAIWDGSGIVVSTDRSAALPIYLASHGEQIVLLMLMLLPCIVIRQLSTRHPHQSFRLSAGMLVIVSISLTMLFHLRSSVGFLRNKIAIAHVVARHHTPEIADISFEELERYLHNPAALIIDARLRRDFARGHIPRAVNLPVYSGIFDRNRVLQGVPDSTSIIVYCQSNRCDWGDSIAADFMLRGYKEVVVYRGGYQEWRSRTSSR